MSYLFIHSFIQKNHYSKTVNTADILEETKRYHSQVFSSILPCLKFRFQANQRTASSMFIPIGCQRWVERCELNLRECESTGLSLPGTTKFPPQQNSMRLNSLYLSALPQGTGCKFAPLWLGFDLTFKARCAASSVNIFRCIYHDCCCVDGLQTRQGGYELGMHY